MTSFDVVKKVRQILKEKRVGHCGTLDPMAEGVLIIVFGATTSCSQALMAKQKVYRATMRLGVKTDTGDITGKVLETSPVPAIVPEIIEKCFEKFIGEIDQVPPMFSAVKWKGRKLYEFARNGIEISRPSRKVTVYSLGLIRLTLPLIEFRLICSKGTYVRSLVEEIGVSLSLPATLNSLTRERCGDYSLEESLAWGDLLTMSSQELRSRSFSYPID